MKRIAIFASGRGSNAKNIIDFFRDKLEVEVVLIISNNEKAGVLDIAKEENIEFKTIDRDTLKQPNDFITSLQELKIDLIVLAGFLWLIPSALISAFQSKIINIHPGLLPKYGGKGMYGMHVHRAVKNAKDVESGITIHYVNERYDEGAIIFQTKCTLTNSDSPEDIAKRVLRLEHKFYPLIISQLLTEAKDLDSKDPDEAS